MSQIAAAAGIGRATLYKYFPDVEQVVAAWHDRQVAEHLAQLAAIPEQPGDSAEAWSTSSGPGLATSLRAPGRHRHRSFA